MANEPEITLPTEEPRRCPSCGTRVAAKATTCLMCGASLVEEEAAPEEEAGRLPNWARALIVVMLALVILAATGFGFYRLMIAGSGDSTPTATPSRTPPPAPTATPTRTPTPLPTSTPVPPLVYQVQVGDTLSDIATVHDTTIEAILAMNPDVEPENLPVGQVLLIPAGTATPEPTRTLSPDASTIIHIVAPGEALSSIAEQYGVSVSLIREVNELPIGDDTIFVNQSLIIPLSTPTPSPAPTVDPRATPTPLPPYTAPHLLSPPDGATLAGTDEAALQWASVSVLRSDEWYALTVSQPSGDAVSRTTYTRATAWRVPSDLLSETGEGEFRWWVQVVREARDQHGELVYEGGGPPSEVRTFIWLAVTPTATPSLAPAP